MLLKDMMQKDVPILMMGDSMEKAVHLYKKSKIDVLPVVGEDMLLVGVFTRTNFLDALLEGATLKDTIDPYITLKTQSISCNTTFDEVKELVKISPVGTAPVLDEKGRVCGIFTKTNMVLTLLRKSDQLNAQLKAILDAMHNAVVAVDKGKRVTLLNRSAERLIGTSKEAWENKPVDELLPGISIDHALEGVATLGDKYHIGDTVTIMNILPVSCPGTIHGAVIVLQDLTDFERVARELETVKELNRTLDTVLNIINDGIVVVDRDGVVSLVNRVLADFLKKPVGELVGFHITNVIKNSRLHLVSHSGVPELSEIISVGDEQLIVSRLPIIKSGKAVGAVGKIIFPQLTEIKELARKLNIMQNKLAYYQEELKKAGGDEFDVNNIVAVSPSMVRVKNEAKQVSRGRSTVLITGESGTGKEYIARAIHAYSDRRKSPFIMVNCAAIPDNLLESELFGYDPGAFTGADRGGKPGRFELAHRGTIFLDEIGDMSIGLQAKLLRFLQERSFERVGGTKTINVDVRIVSATNKNLQKAIKEGFFREDLFYRLNVINLRIPPLRERPEDIHPLLSHILDKFSKIMRINITGVAPETIKILMGYHWPGNVRELENVMERAVNFAIDGEIKPSHLPPYLFINEAVAGSEEASGGHSIKNKVRQAEREAILKALDRTGGNKTKAAKLLNMSRSRLYLKMDKLGIKYVQRI